MFVGQRVALKTSIYHRVSLIPVFEGNDTHTVIHTALNQPSPRSPSSSGRNESVLWRLYLYMSLN